MRDYRDYNVVTRAGWNFDETSWCFPDSPPVLFATKTGAQVRQTIVFVLRSYPGSAKRGRETSRPIRRFTQRLPEPITPGSR